MPVRNYEDVAEAYKALTDIEILDDEHNYPVAKVRIPGLCTAKIEMLSEWDYYEHFIPMQQAFLSYYANTLTRGEFNDKEAEKIKTKMNMFIDELNSQTTREGLLDKAKGLTFLFDDKQVRKYFFKKLKVFGIFPWWVSWRRYQKKSRPIDTMTIFVFLWSFNVDGLKKNAKFLMAKIGAIMSTASPTASKYSGDLDSFKKVYLKAKERLNNNSKESSTSAPT